MIDLAREGDVFVLRMDSGENRFSPEFVARYSSCLDEVEQVDGPKALVTTGTGKFYSNGLDLENMMADGGAGANRYIASVLELLRRTLVLPCVSVAAVNGHAFGAGGQIAVAHDIRLMRSDRGFFCMPEIDMHAPLHPGMVALLKARIPSVGVHEVLVTGRRYGGELAAEKGIVDRALPEADLLPAAIEQAAALADKAHPVMSRIKADLYPKVIEAMALPLGSAAI
ncbi:MAG: enoyl-CoA hydratase/isomerase family protein [Deltaproteobacteria bacterium]|nr:enoyl-CoA hydratase/isomerase family protein [Deltaproteobacteria bacterium]MBW2363364.1 enoyl-CoA hydratase/isomerase family protein [Deltaproteobacteria bacterium]